MEQVLDDHEPGESVPTENLGQLQFLPKDQPGRTEVIGSLLDGSRSGNGGSLELPSENEKLRQRIMALENEMQDVKNELKNVKKEKDTLFEVIRNSIKNR